jgi:hypothetical protein
MAQHGDAGWYSSDVEDRLAGEADGGRPDLGDWFTQATVDLSGRTTASAPWRGPAAPSGMP